ncbi:hypothetical protein [Phyllobacterium sp. UNC302MFCol5.2]|uniref:hypothetical protein n=1 Tax=Phyllobacterium sp. UNC302MFCol5.2 TaxID=1449065 RepID=UPI000482DA7E|nr:hypothetical protein [Phyllobacterium sp. UNC302MFCol5.2]
MADQHQQNLGNEQDLNNAIGGAIAWWNQLEDNLGHVFCATFGGINHPVARNAYLAAGNFTPRFNMVHAAMLSARLDKANLDKWDALYKRIKDKSQIRNKLIHFSRVAIPDKAGNHVSYVVPNFWKLEEFGKAMAGKGVRWNWVQINKFGQEFGKIAVELVIFAGEIEDYVCEHPIEFYPGTPKGMQERLDKQAQAQG